MTDTVTLEGRITNILLAGGFTGATRFTPGNRPAFTVAEGVGAIVGLSWEVSTDERAEMVARYETCLKAAGLPVENRGQRLYIPDRYPAPPDTAVADRAHYLAQLTHVTRSHPEAVDMDVLMSDFGAAIEGLTDLAALHVRMMVDCEPPFIYCGRCPGQPTWPCQEYALITKALGVDAQS